MEEGKKAVDKDFDEDAHEDVIEDIVSSYKHIKIPNPHSCHPLFNIFCDYTPPLKLP